MKKYLVVYYSRTGTTKKAAQRLYELLGRDADIEQIIDLKDRSGFLGALSSVKDCLTNNITKTEAVKHQPSDYFNVIVMTPIWGGKMADAIRTYLAAYKSDIKVLYLVTCAGGQNGDSVRKDVFRRFALKAKKLVSLKQSDVARGGFDDAFDCILNDGKVEADA